MPDQLDNGHVLTDEDVDTAQLIKQLNDRLGRATDDVTLRIADTPLARVRQVVQATNSHPVAERLDAMLDDGQVLIVPDSVAETLRSDDSHRKT
jgi:hypothetical protein